MQAMTPVSGGTNSQNQTTPSQTTPSQTTPNPASTIAAKVTPLAQQISAVTKMPNKPSLSVDVSAPQNLGDYSPPSTPYAGLSHAELASYYARSEFRREQRTKHT